MSRPTLTTCTTERSRLHSERRAAERELDRPSSIKVCSDATNLCPAHDDRGPSRPIFRPKYRGPHAPQRRRPRSDPRRGRVGSDDHRVRRWRHTGAVQGRARADTRRCYHRSRRRTKCRARGDRNRRVSRRHVLRGRTHYVRAPCSVGAPGKRRPTDRDLDQELGRELYGSATAPNVHSR
jgi:hypothetical protein